MRVNLATNYTFLNGDLSGWSAENGAVISYTKDYAFYGAGGLQVSKGAANASGVVMNTPIAVQAGKSYAISMYARLPLTIPASDTAELSLTVTWANSAGTVVGTNTSGNLMLEDDSQWYRLSGVWTAPPGATVMSSVRIYQPIAGRLEQKFILDALLIEQASYVGGFFFTHSEAEKYRLAQKALSRVPQVINGLRLGADVSLNNLTFNTIDEFGTIWVIENIGGWDGQTAPEMPDIGRGTDDGSYDVEGRLTSRAITLSGFFIPADPDQALTDTKDRLVEAINLVRKGGWLRAHSEPTRAAWVRLSGAPTITTTNDRGRTQFAITLRAPDPIKYHWNDGDPDGYTRASVRSADIPDETYTNMVTNPSFEAGTAVEVWRNLVANSAFETAGTTQEVRRNWNPSPRMVSSTTGWATTGAAATMTATANGIQVDITTGPTSAPMIFQSADLPPTTGDLWSSSMEISVPTGFASVSLQLRNYAYGSNQVIGQSAVTTILPGETVTLSAPSSTAVGASDTGVRTILYANGLATGQRFVVRNALAEKAPTPGKYFDGVNVPKVRRNIALNPRAVTGGAASWVSNDNPNLPVTRVTSFPVPHPMGITTGADSRSAAGATSALASLYNIDGLLNTGTPQRSSGVWVLVTEPGYQMVATWGATPLTANTWTFVKTTTPVAAGAHNTIGINKTTGNASTTARAYFTGIATEEGATAPADYFDVTASSAPGFAYTWEGTVNASASYMYDTDFSIAWTGTADASASILTGSGVAGVAATGGVAIRSSRWKKNGSYSMRLIPTSTTAAAAAVITGLPTTNLTSLVTSYIEAPLTGTIDVHAMSLRRTIPTALDKRPNTAGEYQHRLVAPGSGGNIEMWGARRGGGDIWFDQVAAISGVYSGPAFNGDASPDVDLSAAWVGTVNNSASTLSGFTPTGLGGTTGVIAVRSSQWAKTGSYSLRLISTATTEGSAYAVLNVGAPSETRGTVRLSMYRQAAQTDRGYAHYGKIYWNPVPQPMSPKWVGAGTNEASILGVPGAAASSVVLVHGGVSGDPDLFVDDYLRVEGDYQGPNFNGDTVDVPGAAYDWVGTPNASASVRRVWLTDYLDNIGNANVSGLFTITGPAGPGSRIYNSLTDETITLAEPLRGKATVGTVIKMAAYNNKATLTTDRYSGLRVGDKVSLLGLPVPFTTPGKVYEVTASSDVFPFSFSFDVPSDDIDEVSVTGQVALAENDVLVVDTYDKSVTYNGEITGHRYRLVTLTDWVRFGPGLNPIEYFDDALQINVVNKKTTEFEATVETQDVHYLRPGDQVLVALPETANLAKKSLSANVVTITTAEPHGFALGDTVDVVSVETSTINYKARAGSTVTLTTVEENGVSVNDYITVVLPVTAVPSTKQLTTNVATITTQQAHGFSIGDSVTVALPVSATVAAKQLISNVATLTTIGSHGYAPGDSITVSMPAGAAVSKKERIGSLAYITTSTAHGYSVGDTVIVALPSSATVSSIAADGVSNLVTVTTTATHNFSLGDKVTLAVPVFAINSISQRSATTTTATLTIGSHNWAVGDRVTVTGIDARFNGSFYITAVAATTISYASAGATVGATATTGATATNRTLTDTYNGTKVVEATPTATTFTFRDWDQNVNSASRTFAGTVTNDTNVAFNGTKTLQSASGVTFTYNL